MPKKMNSVEEDLLKSHARQLHHFKVLIPSYAAGSLIGPGGGIIMRLERDFSVRITVSRKNDIYPGTFDRVCLISGDVENILKANDHIMERVSKMSDTIPYQSKKMLTRDEQVKFFIPQSSASKIAGPNGINIEKLKAASGSVIYISALPKNVQMHERFVIVSGDLENNKKACHLIFKIFAKSTNVPFYLNVSYSKVDFPIPSAEMCVSALANSYKTTAAVSETEKPANSINSVSYSNTNIPSARVWGSAPPNVSKTAAVGEFVKAANNVNSVSSSNANIPSTAVWGSALPKASKTAAANNVNSVSSNANIPSAAVWSYVPPKACKITAAVNESEKAANNINNASFFNANSPTPNAAMCGLTLANPYETNAADSDFKKEFYSCVQPAALAQDPYSELFNNVKTALTKESYDDLVITETNNALSTLVDSGVLGVCLPFLVKFWNDVTLLENGNNVETNNASEITSASASNSIASTEKAVSFSSAVSFANSTVSENSRLPSPDVLSQGTTGAVSPLAGNSSSQDSVSVKPPSRKHSRVSELDWFSDDEFDDN